MGKRTTERIEKVAERQFGLIASRQLNGKSASLESFHHGVKRVRGAPVTAEMQIYAAFLAVPKAVASHRTAAWLWRIGGDIAPSPVELLVEYGSASTRGGITVRRSRTLTKADRTKMGQFRVTTPARTIIDLSGVLPPEQLEQALDDLWRRGLVRMPVLARRVDTLGRGTKGCGQLKALIDDRFDQKPTGSVLETNFYAALRERGVPQPTRQHVIRDGIGRFIARVDFAFVELKIAIEVDSITWHTQLDRFESDRSKQNRFTNEGWHPLRFTKRRLERDIEAVAHEVRVAYDKRRSGEL